MKNSKTNPSLAWALLGSCLLPFPSFSAQNFPLLLGMNIAEQAYIDNKTYLDKLAKLNVVILGFYPWDNQADLVQRMRDVTGYLKSKKPTILLGQYTILNETTDDVPQYLGNADKARKINQENWWVRNAAGQRMQWTQGYDAWDINITKWTVPDAQGLRYPQWEAQRDYNTFFKDVANFDIWYFDNVWDKPRDLADWTRDGVDDDPSRTDIAQAYREAQVVEWDSARNILGTRPMIFMGNSNNDLTFPEYQGKLGAAFLEALMGQSWSVETWGGWSKMMLLYQRALQNTKDPKIVGFNVVGNPTDYRFFRYAYTSCLLDNGYFSFTDITKGYGNYVSWFDEYNFQLGTATSSPPTAAWQNGVWRRDYQNGIVLVNSGPKAVTVTVGKGYARLIGSQDKKVNSGTSVSKVTIPSRDGIVLRRM